MIFKVCISDPFKNCEKIVPLEQKNVANLINFFKDDKNVLKIIVFGSSTRSDWKNHFSDLDFYLELNEEKFYDLSSLNFKKDQRNNFMADENFKRKILEKGVVVYERE